MAILFSASGSPLLSGNLGRILIKPFLVDIVEETQSIDVKTSNNHKPENDTCFMVKNCPEKSK